MDEEHQNNIIRMRRLNDEADQQNILKRTLDADQSRLHDEVELLRRERSDLAQRINEVNSKYEIYVQTMSNERIDLNKANKDHVKLLTSKIMFQLLDELATSRISDGFQAINTKSKDIMTKKKCLRRVSMAFGKFSERRQRSCLKTWYRNALNFSSQNTRIHDMADMKAKKKIETTFYYIWRNQFLSRVRAKEDKIEALKMMRGMTEDNNSF